MSFAREVPAGHLKRLSGADGRALLEHMNGVRHEELALWSIAQLDIGRAARMLDIGCGGGANLARLLELAPEGRVFGLDRSPLSVEVSREKNRAGIAAGRCGVYEGDSSALPFPDAAFDVVTAFENVCYWDLEPSFAEVHRVLADGGQFLICNEDDAGDPEMTEYAQRIPGMEMYTAGELEACLYEMGFSVVRSHHGSRGELAVIAIKR